MKPAFQIDNTQTRTEKILLVCVDFPHIPDFNIAVAEAVQNAVTTAVQDMTGMGKPVVNVHISGVAFEK